MGTFEVIRVKWVGFSPENWPAYRGLNGIHQGFYYIRQPDSCREMSWYRCSKDWEPDYKCRPELFIVIGKNYMAELDTYTNGDNEQPVTCPRCGSRTAFDQIDPKTQHHRCLGCIYEFLMEDE